jgi:hypothetical protein
MRRIAIVTALAGFMAAMGCVHIPSAFESHAKLDIRQQIRQHAAAVLDFIEGKTEALPAPKKTSWLDPVRTFLAPTAHAAGNDAMSGILVALRNRNPQIVDLKARRLVGETNRGYLEFRDDPSLDAKTRNAIQQVVAAENKDRKLLYEDDARIERERNATVSMVERGYAIERLKRAKAGECVQLPSKGDDFDAFEASAAGQRLGAACLPEVRVILK